MTDRPWCCPEPRCTPIHSVQGGDQPLTVPQPGEMFVCFGKAPEVTFDYDGAKHRNDLRQCSYTALKGVIAFQENADDWRGMQNAYGRALAALAGPATPTDSRQSFIEQMAGLPEGRRAATSPARKAASASTTASTATSATNAQTPITRPSGGPAPPLPVRAGLPRRRPANSNRNDKAPPALGRGGCSVCLSVLPKQVE